MKKIYCIIVSLICFCFFNVKAEERVIDTKRIMIVGAYEFAEGSPFHYLPGVKCEIDSIAALFPVDNVLILEGRDATLSNLNLSREFHPSILHITGHGIPLPRNGENLTNKKNLVIPLYHEIVDSDSKDKTTFDRNTDLYISNFSDFFPENIELVVLSVSESYNPDVINYLITAGVKSAILANGRIDDTATQLFMTEFYRTLNAGKSKQESLKAAQDKVRNFKGEINGEYRNFSNPRYWAGFILLDGLD